MNKLLKIDRVAWDAKWKAMEQEELRLAKESDETMTIEQSARIYLGLCALGEPHFKATEEIFRADRLNDLAQLQASLQRFGRWWEKHHGSATSSV